MKATNGYAKARIDDEVWAKLSRNGYSVNRSLRLLFGLPDKPRTPRPRSTKGAQCVVELDRDVWREISKRAKAFESPCKVIRRVLGLPVAVHPSRGTISKKTKKS